LGSRQAVAVGQIFWFTSESLRAIKTATVTATVLEEKQPPGIPVALGNFIQGNSGSLITKDLAIISNGFDGTLPSPFFGTISCLFNNLAVNFGSVVHPRSFFAREIF
jgi:spore maturation protein SpmB